MKGLEEGQHISIGKMINYYGGVYVMEYEGKFYWIIQDCDTDFSKIEEWEEITEGMFNEMVLFENNRDKSKD